MKLIRENCRGSGWEDPTITTQKENSNINFQYSHSEKQKESKEILCQI